MHDTSFSFLIFKKEKVLKRQRTLGKDHFSSRTKLFMFDSKVYKFFFSFVYNIKKCLYKKIIYKKIFFLLLSRKKHLSAKLVETHKILLPALLKKTNNMKTSFQRIHPNPSTTKIIFLEKRQLQKLFQQILMPSKENLYLFDFHKTTKG